MSIIELAHALGLKVIAEGAEDDATITRLAELGCDYVQGYGLTRPLPPTRSASGSALPAVQVRLLLGRQRVDLAPPAPRA